MSKFLELTSPFKSTATRYVVSTRHEDIHSAV